MIRHIGSSDSIVHDLTMRSGELCEHRAPMILYMMHLCVQLSFNLVCQVYSCPVLANWPLYNAENR